MEDSIFTKIIKGEIPSYKIYDDDNTLAFLDIHPVHPGHIIVIPKKQVEFVWDLDEENYNYLMGTVRKVADHMRETLDEKFVGVQVVGVDVPHAHVHLIPFTLVSEYRNRPDMSSEPDSEALAEMAERLAF
jgi:histidine triad (HIT) family protein